jgi:hypothetical protein
MKSGLITTTVFVIAFCTVTATLLLLPASGNDETKPAGTGDTTVFSSLLINLEVTQDDELVLDYAINEFPLLETEIAGIPHVVVDAGSEAPIQERGMPDLPKIARSVIIPDDRRMTVTVIAAEYREFPDVCVAPSKGTLPRTVDPASVPYEFGEIYDRDCWYPSSVAGLREPYIVRDFRGQAVEVYPYQYNPVQNVLRFYSRITLTVTPVGEDDTNVLVRDAFSTTVSGEFDAIYRSHFVNYEQVMGRYTPVSDLGNMLVISHDSFYDAVRPYVDWKNQQGVPCELVNLSAAGGSASAVKTYITNYYNTNGLTFVLLVGDIAQVPTLSASGYLSDPSYAYVVGSDHYPDLFVGRFSAQTAAQLQTQIGRSLAYEKYPQVNATWYAKGTGIASDDGTGNGDDNEWDWEHLRNIRTDLLGYTYTAVDEFYEGSQGGQDASGNPTASMISAALNDGRSLVNYCGHGYYTSWGTGSFYNSNINALVNDNMLPFVVCVACLNGVFDYSGGDCFAEAWMKATNNGEPTGAIGVYASSKSQAWDPPMDAQDEIVDLLVENYPSNKPRSLGSLAFQGAMHMNDNYGSAGYIETDCWHLFGDPSLKIRTAAPVQMTPQHDPAVPLGATEFSVSVPGFQNALCALSLNGTLLAADHTDATGTVTLTFENITALDTLTLTVTAFNAVPYVANVAVNGEFNMTLHAGWNLITLPVESNHTAKSLLAAIPGCTLVYGYDAANATAHIVTANSPPETDFPVLEGVGYFVAVSANTTLSVTGNPVRDVSVDLYPGWNMVGWIDESNTTGKTILANTTNCTLIYWYDAVAGTARIVTANSPPETDFPVSRGMGLFAAVTEQSEWLGRL